MKDKAKHPLTPNRRDLIQNVRAFGFMLPGLAGLFVFYIRPFSTVVRFSFGDNTVTHSFVGTENFRALAENASFRYAIGNSAFLALAGTFFLIVLSLFTAELLSHAKHFTTIVKTVMLTPFVMPAACVALVYSVCTDHSRFFIKIFQAIGVGSSHSVADSYAIWFILLLFLWKNTGYFVLLFSGSMAKINHSILEAAKLDGAGTIRVFFDIKLRSVSPSVLFAILLSVMSSFGMYREVFLIYGSHPPKEAYLISHYLNNTMSNMNYSGMSAAALTVMLAVIILSVALISIERRLGKGMEQ